jgi:very-short-patch-repair endonuclease
MRISEKELTKILQQPGYSAQVEPKQKRQPLPPEVKEIFKYSKHEWRFKCLWESIPGPALEFNYKFDPRRRSRIDFYSIDAKLAIEIEGYGHQKQNRYISDVEKYNRMAEMGIELRRLTSDMITVQELEKIIERIKEKTI